MTAAFLPTATLVVALVFGILPHLQSLRADVATTAAVQETVRDEMKTLTATVQTLTASVATLTASVATKDDLSALRERVARIEALLENQAPASPAALAAEMNRRLDNGAGGGEAVGPRERWV